MKADKSNKNRDELTLNYREVNPEDLDEMAKMYIETFNTPPWNDCWTAETALKRMNQMTSGQDFYGMCVFNDGELCALILGNAEQNCDITQFHIKEFCVRNSIRGKGIGTMIFREYEARLKAIGIQEIILLTKKGHLTEHFYQMQNLKITPEIIMMDKKI